MPIMPAEAGLQPGVLLASRYLIVRTIHRGGMSRLYLAKDAAHGGHEVALKELRPAPDTPLEEQCEAESWFARESYLLSTLRHPLIPRFYSVFREGDRSYIVQEYVVGEDLDRLVARAGPRDERLVLAWGQDLCELLMFLHERPAPIVYRDLKPANILLRRNGQLAVVDFGIARPYVAGQVGTVVGTPGYAPPEQYQGLATPQSDLYALGATLHRLLTGYDPEQGAAFAFPPIGSLNPRVSPGTVAVVERLLRLPPPARYDTARETAAALREAPPAPPLQHAPGQSRIDHGWLQQLWLVAAVLVLAPLMCLGLYRSIHFERDFSGSLGGPVVNAPVLTEIRYGAPGDAHHVAPSATPNPCATPVAAVGPRRPGPVPSGPSIITHAILPDTTVTAAGSCAPAASSAVCWRRRTGLMAGCASPMGRTPHVVQRR